ncbi:hypothetical protein ACXJY6_05375 [Vibrio sp. RC27]
MSITFESLHMNHPEAFHELSQMDVTPRRLLIDLLNGLTTSPPKRDYADIEVDKEDAVISTLKIKHGVEITTKRAHGNYSYHMMTTEQIDEFFNDRESMRKRVNDKIWSMRTRNLDKQLRKGINWRGVDWIKHRCDMLTIYGDTAANDDAEKKKDSSN